MSLAASLLAQPAKQFISPTRLAPAVTNHEGYRDVTLEPGTLREVVQQLDEIYSAVQRANGPTEYIMPNLVWTKEAMNFPVTASLRIVDVGAVDALTLIAAAAGCKLEPVQGVNPETKEARIIGYKFVQAGADGTALRNFGRAGDTGGETLRAVESVPANFNRLGATTPLPAANGQPAGNLATLLAQRTKLLQTMTEHHPAVLELTRRIEFLEKEQANKTITKVYAMGAVLHGNEKELVEKLELIKKSIFVTLHTGGMDEKNVQINYHDGTNVLVIKAPEDAQELITQLIEALRENAKGPNPNPKTSP